MGGNDFPIVLKTDNIMGRYLVASRNIEPGELILQDDPIIVCPNAPTDSDSITCLGCCGIAQTSVACRRCGWPLCKEECGDIPDHADFECKIFEDKQIKLPLSSPHCFIAEAEYIKVLRCLLLREHGKEDPKKLERWNMLLDFEAHPELRKSIPKLLFMSKLVRSFIHDLCKLTQFEDSLIDFILGTIDVNAFKNVTHPLFVNGKNMLPPFQKNATCLYYNGRLVSHGCVRNTQSLTYANGKLEMRAGDIIKKDDMLTHAYTELMVGTPERRKLIKDQYYFECSCSRCADPTENGTYFSALKCQQCTNGFLLMDNPLDSWPYWKCDQCTEIQPTDYETELLKDVRIEEMKILKSGRKNNAMIASWIDLLEKFHLRFHENHYVLLQIQIHLVKCMGKVTKPTPELVEDMDKIISKYKRLHNTFYPNKDN